MPPFSGKKKKEQLQAKRHRKRDEEERANLLERERERLREELVNRGEEVNDDVLDAYMQERNPQHRDPAHGRRAHRREREQQQAAQKRGSSGAHADRSDTDDGDNADGVEVIDGRHSSGSGAATMMYGADRHHGVRSVFAKESAAVLAARKQLSYQPIPFRTTMPPTGIPFGEWFTFPSTSTTSKPDESVEKAEQERRLDRPLVATTAEALGGGSGSVVFPFAVELPSRGWHRAVSTDGVAGEVGVEVEANELTAPDGRATASPDAVRLAGTTRDVATTATAMKDDHDDNPSGESGEADGSDSAESSASGDEEETEEAGSTNADKRRAEALFIKEVEQRRFDAYLRCLDGYPLPAAVSGLDVSSYERNLEVWQQLWRTVELSDVLVVVADARYPILHAHLGLLAYITQVQRKPCVFVLNKEDLVPASTLRCWKQFLHLYLTDLGFSVESPEGKDEAPKGASKEKPENAGESEEKMGRIVLRSFTANPRPETAGQRDGDVDVTRRQKQRKGANAKMYEKLRSGKLNATKHLGAQRHHHNSGSSSSSGNGGGGNGDSSDSDEEEDALRYSAQENFVGMRAAEHALQHDKRAYKELEVVARKITELLAVCRRLGAASRAARGGASAETVTAAAEEAAMRYSTSSLPCAAPRTAPKSKKAQKRGGGGGARRGKKHDDGGAAHDSDEDAAEAVEDRAPDSPHYIHIGFIGHPNVGKSSLLNCIRGTKVVSVSATPGHTKHIQTIPVPAESLTLVDSPGLALPVFGVPRPLQAVLGTHQIAQTRDPQSGVSFLAAYLPIEKLYGLLRPDYAMAEDEWSSYELCEAYAKKRGYYVKHGKGALDIHRAAIALLQEAYEGRLALFYAPPELNLLQSAWYRERIRPNLLLTVFGSSLV